MKKRSTIIILILVFVITYIATVVFSHLHVWYHMQGYLGCVSYPIRTVKVKVIDGKTGEPLEGINVYYGIESLYVEYFILFIMPSPDPWTMKKTEEVAALKTDKNGEVVIPKHKICIRRPHKLHEEQIWINIDMQDNLLKKRSLDDRVGRLCSSPPSSDFHYNPNNKYKGFWIVSFPTKVEYPHYADEIADSLYISNGLNKTEENLVIKLDRRQ